ncbi:hypothetical protein [Candidatus Poriferisocius sp.]|uniref:hypothetical protein n=1 Tax=Candidatus Poriferisocius sp. TaxID=3101276 RepID=UPI003B5AB3C7
MLGGPDIITFLLLALGGALAVGNLAALVNPEGPKRARQDADGDPPSARVGRSVVMTAVGTVIVVWAIASLIRG